MRIRATGDGVLILALSTSLLGCVTPYQPDGFRGGYREHEVEERLYRITFEGNAFASEEYVAKAAMLRAAEFAMARGYPYFETVKESVQSERVFAKSVGMFASSTYPGVTAEKARTTVSGNGPLIFVTKHGAVTLVRLLKIREEGTDGVFTASEVIAALRPFFEK